MNRVKTKRKTVKRDAKRYSFSFEKSLINAFIEKAGECGYNTTEALEVLMQKATEGLLPKKESFLKKLTKAKEESLMNGINPMDITFVINSSDVDRLEKELSEGSVVIKTTEPGGGPKTSQGISFNGIPVVTMDAIKNGEVATIVIKRDSGLTRAEIAETLEKIGQHGLANHYKEEKI